jgi:hypothetical protein
MENGVWIKEQVPPTHFSPIRVNSRAFAVEAEVIRPLHPCHPFVIVRPLNLPATDN